MSFNIETYVPPISESDNKTVPINKTCKFYLAVTAANVNFGTYQIMLL